MSRPYLVTFTDGSKQHVNRRELDTLPNLKPLGERKYLCTVPCRTVRMTATENTLAVLATMPSPMSLDRWPGPDVIVELDGKRYRECGLENPVTMLARYESTHTVDAPDCRG